MSPSLRVRKTSSGNTKHRAAGSAAFISLPYKSAICFRASSRAARSSPHSGQEDPGVAEDSFIHTNDTEVVRNCKKRIDNQIPRGKRGAELGTGRLHWKFVN